MRAFTMNAMCVYVFSVPLFFSPDWVVIILDSPHTVSTYLN